MKQMFATGKLIVQAISLPTANDMWIEAVDDGGMQKQRRPILTPKPRITEEPNEVIFLREWLLALGLKQGKVAEASGVSTSYMSQLVNREKYPDEEPKVATVRAIGAAMEMPWYLLYELPPRGAIPVADLHKYPEALQNRLSAAARRKTA